MAKSPDSTPSPVSSATSVNISAASNRANPFSIDYILSASDEAAAAVAAAAVASSKQHNNSTASQMQQALQLDLINQQRAQLMAAAAAAGSQQTSAARTSETVDQQISNHLQHYLSNQLHMDRRQSAQQQQQQQLPAQSAAMSQIHKPPNQQPPHPNFLYFMACMLLQQQQQQQHQNLQREQQARQQACEQQQQHQQQKQHQLISRQPIDLAQSPIDSLAIFARLAGLPTQPQARRTPGNEHNTTSLGKQTSSAHRPLQASNHHSVARHQPYHAPHHHSPSSHLAAGGNSRAAPMNLHQSQAAFATPPLASAIRQPIPHVLATNNDLSHQTELISRSASHLVGHSPWLQKSSQVSQQQQHLLTSLAPTRQTQQQHLSSSSPLSDIRPASSAGNQEQQQQSGCQLERMDNLKPAHSYIGLIGMCILSSPEKRMVLNDIYHFILDNYPYYRNRGSGWRNSVRHNLSLNECFQKAGRAANGKGHYWTIHPANMEDFMLGDFRRRRAQRKVRRWNNMDVPSDESEDESMEDATKPPLPDHFKRSLEMHRRLELSYQKSVEAAAASFGLQAASGVCLARQQPPQPLQDSIGGGQAMATAAAGGVRTVHHHHLGESPSGACSPLMFCKQDNSAL